MVVSSLGFLFASFFLVLELKKVTTQNCSVQQPGTANECRQKKPQEKPALFSQGPEKGQPRMTGNVQTIIALLQPSTTEKMWPHPHPHPQRPSGEARFLPSQGCNVVPKLGQCQRRLGVESSLSTLPSSNKVTFPHGVSRRYVSNKASTPLNLGGISGA